MLDTVKSSKDYTLLISIVVPICAFAVLLIISILAIKTKRSHSTLNQNFMELIAKIPGIKDVIVLEKLGGGAFGEVYRGLVNVMLVILPTDDTPAIDPSCFENS
jgi:hypothetical protein